MKAFSCHRLQAPCYLHFPSISFPLSPLTVSAYDDIIKLTIEHLTFTLVRRDFPRRSPANRKINIHSCIQRTWLLLCGYYPFFRWIQEGGEVKTIFLLPLQKRLSLFLSSSSTALWTSFIFNWSLLHSPRRRQDDEALPHGSSRSRESTNFLLLLHIQRCNLQFTAKNHKSYLKDYSPDSLQRTFKSI